MPRQSGQMSTGRRCGGRPDYAFCRCDAVNRSGCPVIGPHLRNFSSNAIRYTNPDACCWVAVAKSMACVLNPGTPYGIPSDKLREVVSNEFKRVQTPTLIPQRIAPGLGLAIVDKIARMLGHRIRVRSWEGRGSVFFGGCTYGRPARSNLAGSSAIACRPGLTVYRARG